MHYAIRILKVKGIDKTKSYNPLDHNVWYPAIETIPDFCSNENSKSTTPYYTQKFDITAAIYTTRMYQILLYIPHFRFVSF